MSVLVVSSAALLLLMLAVSLWNAAAAARLRPAPGTAPVRTTVLIPARNEGTRLDALLRSLTALSTADEILVLDDESTDGTAAIAARFERDTDGRVRLLRGAPLPAGWLGKNWACHQLAAQAQGEVLLFCDADVTLTGDAVSATAALLAREDASVATALPAQRYAGSWDAALIPLILHFPLLGLLPLPLVARTRASSVVYGNGQWLAFRREAYDRMGGHAAVRGEVVEDMALVRRAKQQGVRVAAAIGVDVLQVRMYRSLGDAFTGFSRNLYLLLGGSLATAAPGALLFLAAAVLPLGLALLGEWRPLLLLVAVRLLHARLTRAPLTTVLLHPVGAALALIALIRSIIAHHTGTVTWKSRSLSGRRAPAST